MNRRRTITAALLALTLVVTGATAAQADTDESTDAPIQVQERDMARDQARVHDAPSDRPSDRPADRPIDRPVDCDDDGAPDRPRDCRERPDVTDRPAFQRCVTWLLEHTDVDYGDNVRHWLWACHRLFKHFNPAL